jgi:hypothetical protein
LADHNFQSLLLSDNLANHDQCSGNKVGLCCSAELKHFLQKCKNSVDIFILLHGNQDEIEEELSQRAVKDLIMVNELI